MEFLALPWLEEKPKGPGLCRSRKQGSQATCPPVTDTSMPSSPWMADTHQPEAAPPVFHDVNRDLSVWDDTSFKPLH